MNEDYGLPGLDGRVVDLIVYLGNQGNSINLDTWLYVDRQ